jgi:type I restriction enzyme S subunit
VAGHLTAAKRAIDRFRQSVLAAACSGRLTLDWRAANPEASARVLSEDLRSSASLATENYREAKVVEESMADLDPGDLAESWAIAPLHLLIERGRPITYGILKPGPDVPNGIPYLRVTDFKSGTVISKNIRRTTPEIAQQYRRSVLREGDLLFAIRGTFGQVAAVPADLAGANITQDTARLSVDARLSADYVSLVLTAPQVQRRISKAAKGVAVRGINLGDLRELLLPLPPRPEQDEIVHRVARLLAHAESIVSRIDSVHRATEISARSILSKAIGGDIQSEP